MYQYKYVFAQLIAFLPINRQLSFIGTRKGPAHTDRSLSLIVRVIITSQLQPVRRLYFDILYYLQRYTSSIC